MYLSDIVFTPTVKAFQERMGRLGAPGRQEDLGRALKTLRGLTPYEFICKRWISEPDRFRLDPIHQMPGLNT